MIGSFVKCFHLIGACLQSASMNKEEGALKPTREMFVQYKHHSYWDCEFVPEMQVITGHELRMRTSSHGEHYI